MASSIVLPLRIPLPSINLRGKGTGWAFLHHLRYVITLFLYVLLSAFRFLLLHFPAVRIQQIPRPGTAGEISQACLDSAVGRALAQVLSLTTEIPVNSRKYDVLRGLGDRIISENASAGIPSLAEINQEVVSSAFKRTLDLLEASMEARLYGWISPPELKKGSRGFGLLRVVDGARSRLGFVKGSTTEVPAEKLALELLWLAEKLDVCGAVDQAIRRLGSASHVARLAISAEPRLQTCVIKLTVFILSKIKEVQNGESNCIEESQILQFLLCWMPLFCQASNGVDAPVLSSVERIKVEAIMDQTIDSLALEDQEKVLSVWLENYSSSNSDWPNLQQCYNRWYSESRKLVSYHVKTQYDHM